MSRRLNANDISALLLNDEDNDNILFESSKDEDETENIEQQSDLESEQDVSSNEDNTFNYQLYGD